MELKKIKLNMLSELTIQSKAMNALRGGNCCDCSCYYEDKKGSSSNDNMNANYKLDTYSPIGCNQYHYCDYNDGSWTEEAHA